jgi:uncharacterized membrane protein
MNRRSLTLVQAVLWATTLLVTALMLEEGAQKTQMLLLFTSLAAAVLLSTGTFRSRNGSCADRALPIACRAVRRRSAP